VFHIGIDIDRMATDWVLIDQAEPGAAGLLAEMVWSDALPGVSGPARARRSGAGMALSRRRGRAGCRAWPGTGMRRWRR
jgi:hypothetical protein